MTHLGMEMTGLLRFPNQSQKVFACSHRTHYLARNIFAAVRVFSRLRSNMTKDQVSPFRIHEHQKNRFLCSLVLKKWRRLQFLRQSVFDGIRINTSFRELSKQGSKYNKRFLIDIII